MVGPGVTTRNKPAVVTPDSRCNVKTATLISTPCMLIANALEQSLAHRSLSLNVERHMANRRGPKMLACDRECELYRKCPTPVLISALFGIRCTFCTFSAGQFGAWTSDAASGSRPKTSTLVFAPFIAFFTDFRVELATAKARALLRGTIKLCVAGYEQSSPVMADAYCTQRSQIDNALAVRSQSQRSARATRGSLCRLHHLLDPPPATAGRHRSRRRRLCRMHPPLPAIGRGISRRRRPLHLP